MKRAIFLGGDGKMIEDCCVHKSEDLGIIENCECKKPSIKNMGKIVSRYCINLLTLLVIGDRPSDKVIGRNAGCRAVYLSWHGREHF